MRIFLKALVMVSLLAGCSDEPEPESGQKHEHGNATEHTIEQSADQAGDAMDAAGEEVDVVTGTVEEAGKVAAEAEQVADEAAGEVEQAAQKTVAAAEQAVDEVAGRDPQEIYTTYCKACHAQGVAGAPKLEDTQAWQQRLSERGRDGLVQNAINGYKAMPAKGACMQCSDEEIRATVNWMLKQAGV